MKRDRSISPIKPHPTKQNALQVFYTLTQTLTHAQSCLFRKLHRCKTITQTAFTATNTPSCFFFFSSRLGLTCSYFKYKTGLSQFVLEQTPKHCLTERNILQKTPNFYVTLFEGVKYIARDTLIAYSQLHVFHGVYSENKKGVPLFMQIKNKLYFCVPLTGQIRAREKGENNNCFHSHRHIYSREHSTVKHAH